MNEVEVIVVEGLPPTTNHSYGVSAKSGKARMYKTADAKAWQEAVEWAILTQRKAPHQDWKDKPLAFSLSVWCKDRHADLDGGVKLTLDAAAKGFGFNDKWVDDLHVIRYLGDNTGDHIVIYLMEAT